MKQAEKLKSCKMVKDEGWMINVIDEWWRMNDEDKQTDNCEFRVAFATAKWFRMIQ